MPRRRRSEISQARQFAVVLAVLLAVLAAWATWRGHPVRAAVLGTAAVLPVLLAFALPRVWLAAFRLWMRFAEALGWLSTHLILGAFFSLVLTPVGLVMRALGKAPLDLEWGRGHTTSWITRAETERSMARYEKQY